MVEMISCGAVVVQYTRTVICSAYVSPTEKQKKLTFPLGGLDNSPDLMYRK